MHSDINEPIWFKLCVKIDSKLCIWISAKVTSTFTLGHRDVRKQTLLQEFKLRHLQADFLETGHGDRDYWTFVFWYQSEWPWTQWMFTVLWYIKTSVIIFLESSLLIWMKCRILPQPVGLLKLILKIILHNSYSRDKTPCKWFHRRHVHIGLCTGVYDPIYFKFVMVLDTTKLFSLIPVWMSFTFTIGHKVMRKNLCKCSFVKWHEEAQTFVTVGCVREMNKSCMYDEHGSFKHLLILLVHMSRWVCIVVVGQSKHCRKRWKVYLISRMIQSLRDCLLLRICHEVNLGI